MNNHNLILNAKLTNRIISLRFQKKMKSDPNVEINDLVKKKITILKILNK